MDLQIHIQRGRPSILPRNLLGVIVAFLVAFCGSGLLAQTKKPASTSSSAKKQPAKKSAKKRTSSRSRSQEAPTTDRIREIQEALARAGKYPSAPTGKWDTATSEAMRSFQEEQGLKLTGKLDALTLQRLGLGSPVAGVAPPRTVASTAPSSNP